MLITPLVKKILLSITWRARTYETFWLSRHEHEKYKTTQDKLRYIIKKLKAEWYITLEWYEPNPSFPANPIRAKYKATTKLFDLVKSFAKSIENMNEKIIDWCKNQKPFDLMRSFWLEVTTGGRIGGKESKITVNKRTWSVTNWKEWKSWNLFWYLREQTGQGVLEFYKNFVNAT